MLIGYRLSIVLLMNLTGAASPIWLPRVVSSRVSAAARTIARGQ